MERSDQKLQTLIEWLVSTIGRLGYPGIAALMFLESSFFPFPSEVVMPPAGYLAAQGRMNLWVAIAMGTLGSLLGALFNYWVAVRFGRPFLE
ncbi:MAG TPA: DedA family protein, partial [Thermosynergistes sp.]|nr:DedA family protein [Thermosynergistes sp.]